MGCTYNEQRGSRATFAVCTASARMRSTTSPDLVTTYDAKVPSATPSSPVVASVPVSAMATSVFAHSAEEGRSESARFTSSACASAETSATARGAAGARRDAGLDAIEVPERLASVRARATQAVAGAAHDIAAIVPAGRFLRSEGGRGTEAARPSVRAADRYRDAKRASPPAIGPRREREPRSVRS